MLRPFACTSLVLAEADDVRTVGGAEAKAPSPLPRSQRGTCWCKIRAGTLRWSSTSPQSDAHFLKHFALPTVVAVHCVLVSLSAAVQSVAGSFWPSPVGLHT